MYLFRMRVRAQCAGAAARRVGVVCHDGEEDRARIASEARFDRREEPVLGCDFEWQPVLQRRVCIYLLPEFVDMNGWSERRQYHPLRLEGVLVERERPIDIIGIRAIVSV